MARLHWPPIIAHAADIVNSYDTPVTLRQTLYRLIADRTLPNTKSSYKRLSSLTAEGRRHGTFPELADRGRTIHRYPAYADPAHALDVWINRYYRLDRTLGQDVSIYLAVEKAGLVTQLDAWFGDLGIPILALGGYASQSYCDEVTTDATGRRAWETRKRVAMVAADVPTHRPAVLLYAGDFDPSGEDIDRDFTERTGCWAKVVRIGLNEELIETHQLPVNVVDEVKGKDARSKKFIARHADFIARHTNLVVPPNLDTLSEAALRRLVVQVEVDALPPETLRDLFDAAIGQFWDDTAYRAVLLREDADVSTLRALAEQLGGER